MSQRAPEKARPARLTIASESAGWAGDVPAPQLRRHARRRPAGEALCRASNARAAAEYAAAHRAAEPVHAVAAVLARRERFCPGLLERSRGQHRGYIEPDYR